jgi:hypothetical protein
MLAVAGVTEIELKEDDEEQLTRNMVTAISAQMATGR